jgi:hypothetical protein
VLVRVRRPVVVVLERSVLGFAASPCAHDAFAAVAVLVADVAVIRGAARWII